MTYAHYTAPVGGLALRYDTGCWGCSVTGSWGGAATRGWFAEAEWRALNSHFSLAFRDTFDVKSAAYTWSGYQTVPFDDGGNLVVKSDGTNANWNANYSRTVRNLGDGQAMQVRFKVTGYGTGAHFSLETTDPTYRRFGIYADYSGIYGQSANDPTWQSSSSPLIGGIQLHMWYVVRISINGPSGSLVEVWQESNPAVRGTYQATFPTGRTWNFHHWVYRDTAYLDDYREYKP